MARLVALRRLRRFNAQVEIERQFLARWIDENLDYGSLYFFPTLWAVNVQRPAPLRFGEEISNAAA